MIAGPVLVTLAVKVTDAIPFTVLAAEAESAPEYGGSEMFTKLTTVPSDTALFMKFRTFAVIFVVWPLIRLGLTTTMLIEAGSLVMKKLALTDERAPAVADTVTAPEEVPE
jgi:hypothetical protein